MTGPIRPSRYGYLSGSVFAAYEAPTAPVRDVAYVVCPPLGYEAIQCYHTLRLLARGLAEVGFHTIRVDYHGTGESLGNDEDPGRLNAWLASIQRAVTALSELDQVESVGLVGLRLGATLAARVAAEMDINRLVLWEPCVTGAMYTRELEIMASASSGSLLADPSATGSAPLGLVAAGYALTSETIHDLSGLRIDQTRPRGRPDVLVIERDDRPSGTRVAHHFASLGCRTAVERVSGFKEMMVAPAKSQVPWATLDSIRDWCTRGSTPTRSRGSEPILEREISDGPLRHYPVRFGPSDRLFGVVSEPSAPVRATRPTVILLAGGAVPRTAVNRMYVTLAHRLANLGHCVLRVDVSGIGESLPADGAPPNDPYPTDLLEDVSSALRWAGSRDLPEDVWLIGLCSGAYAAFQTALAEPKVVGAVLINPLVFYWEPGKSPEAPTAQMLLEARRHRGSLLSMRSWKRVLSGRVDLRLAVRSLTARAKHKTRMALERTGQGNAPGKPLGTDLRHLMSRGVRVRLVFSEGDPGYDAFLRQAGSSLKNCLREGLVLRSFRGADHTFSPMQVRGELLDWIVDQVSAGSEPTARLRA